MLIPTLLTHILELIKKEKGNIALQVGRWGVERGEAEMRASDPNATGPF